MKKKIINYILIFVLTIIIITCLFNIEGMENNSSYTGNFCSSSGLYRNKADLDCSKPCPNGQDRECGNPPAKCFNTTECPEPPPQSGCTVPCKVKYTPCHQKFSQELITNIKKPETLVKVVYISAWEIQGTFSEWKKYFRFLIQAGYNVIIISFLPQKNKNLNIPNWDILSCQEKAELKQFLIDSNAVLLLSIGGGKAPHPTPFPGTNSNCMFNWIDLKDNSDNYIAKYAHDQLFDGIDFDLEHFSRGGSDSNTVKGCGDNLARQADAMRNYYRQKDINPIIISAPQTPYFTEKAWAIDYVEIEKNHPNTFDWYNIQFYNNGNGNTFESTIGYGGANKPETAIYMLNKGIPKNKIVLGKCGKGGNCCDQSDYVDGETLLRWAIQIELKGIMYWSYLGDCTPEATDWLRGNI